MRPLGSLMFAAVVLTALQRVALAQGEMQLADRGPRFLLAAAPEPKALDIRRTPALRQRVTLDLRGATLEQALREIGRQSGLRFVYSQDLIPASSPVELRAESITVAAALTELLVDAGVDVVLSPSGQAMLTRQGEQRQRTVQVGTVVGRVTDAKTQTALAGATVVVQGTSHSGTTGSDGRYRIVDMAPGTYTVRARYIGYAPGTASVMVTAKQEATADLALEKSAQRLDEVVTTGTVVPTEVKAIPTPISVVTGEELAQKGYQRVDQIFRGDVPGAIAWDPGPFGYTSNISVRGANTLTVQPSIKTFIDGVEVANPIYVAMIDPQSVDRIEITRGPQASTLYGAGALSGVMQIFTKNGQSGLAGPLVAAKVSAGGVSGFDGQSTALQTDDALSVSGASGKTTYNIGGSYRHVGEWTPSYNSSNWSIAVGSQTTQGPLTLSGSARYADITFDQPWDTRLQSYTYFSRPFNQTHGVRQQTYGVTASLQATRNWQHTLTLGFDQTYDTQDQTQPRLTTPSDSFLSLTTFHESQVSLLYHTDLTLRLGPALTAVGTVGINYDAHDLVFASVSGATRTTGSLNGSTFEQRAPWNNTGYFGQVRLGFAEQLFVTGGLRAERNDNFGAGFGTAWSPRVGAAYIVGLGPARMKVRASYGESIRAPYPGWRDAVVYPNFQYAANPALAPERQHGVDGGVEVYLGRALLGVTYYNQRAIDLIDLITIPTPPGTLLTYQYQNVSRVKNEGWEFEAQLPLGPVQLAGTYSITNSTVQQLPPDYGGDYRVGDRILGIPPTTAGASISYSPLPQTMLTASMTHIGQWTNYDYLAIYGYAFGGQPYLGSGRAYWMQYPTVTKFAVGVSQELRKGLTAFVRAENVGNTLRFEQYNSNIPTPRSLLVGVNVRY